MHFRVVPYMDFGHASLCSADLLFTSVGLFMLSNGAACFALLATLFFAVPPASPFGQCMMPCPLQSFCCLSHTSSVAVLNSTPLYTRFPHDVMPNFTLYFALPLSSEPICTFVLWGFNNNKLW